MLQVKEATDSVLTRHGRSRCRGGPRRVWPRRATVSGSWPSSASSRWSPTPSWAASGTRGTTTTCLSSTSMLGSIELEGLPIGPFGSYAGACATMLARAHSQSPGVDRVVGYLGRSDAVADAVVQWSFDYARQSLADFEALRAAGRGQD